MAPPGVHIRATRLAAGARPPETLREEVARLEDDLPHAALRLAEADPAVLVYGCAASSFAGAGDAWITDAIQRVLDRPVVTVARAACDGLCHLGVTRVGVGTPYPRDVNDDLVGYLTDAGLRVVAVESIPYEKGTDPNAAFDLGSRLGRRRVEGLFFCCTDLATAQALDPLERSLGKPVVSANQAGLWACLGRLGLAGRVAGYGSLLAATQPWSPRGKTRTARSRRSPGGAGNTACGGPRRVAS